MMLQEGGKVKSMTREVPAFADGTRAGMCRRPIYETIRSRT